MNGMNHKVIVNVSATNYSLVESFVKKDEELKHKGVDITHLEEDVKIEEEYLNHFFHHKQD